MKVRTRKAKMKKAIAPAIRIIAMKMKTTKKTEKRMSSLSDRHRKVTHLARNAKWSKIMLLPR